MGTARMGRDLIDQTVLTARRVVMHLVMHAVMHMVPWRGGVAVMAEAHRVRVIQRGAMRRAWVTRLFAPSATHSKTPSLP